jgi:hypothetical protein
MLKAHATAINMPITAKTSTMAIHFTYSTGVCPARAYPGTAHVGGGLYPWSEKTYSYI